MICLLILMAVIMFKDIFMLSNGLNSMKANQRNKKKERPIAEIIAALQTVFKRFERKTYTVFQI
jgi:hypothetical protein